MKCKVTVQPLYDGVDVEIPEHFTGVMEVHNGLLYLVDLPPDNEVDEIIETSEPVKAWWEFWR